MATLTLVEGTPLARETVVRLVEAACELDRTLGDATAVAGVE